MKRLILFELFLIFFATTFETDSPPGWFQQTLPVNDFINDIFFIDSLNGWVVTQGKTSPPDSAYIMRTSDGGNNWSVQYSITRDFNSLQFIDINTGYSGGGSGNGTRYLYKTTNGGVNWVQIMGSLGVGGNIVDMSFVNESTGWICDNEITDGGLFKTTNGGLNWQTQLDASFRPARVFFLNNDTGWIAGGNISANLYRTTNSGTNWELQYTFPGGINDLLFINSQIGVTTGAVNYRTTNGGFDWIQSQTNISGNKIAYGSDSILWAGWAFMEISKTTNGGVSWFYQTSPVFNNASASASDTNKAWAGGSGIVHTTDGGGPPVAITTISSQIPSEFMLYQNYPNPFNAMTKLKFQMSKPGFVQIKIFSIEGREITILVNKELTSGTYETDWNANSFSSGAYFYQLIVDGQLIDTKKMLLVK
jgi:photosystem II stability/assembly factor-like uncharacterized protein